MNFKQFLEDVVDKSDDFKKRQSKNFDSRLNKAVSDAMSGISSQREMEDYVRSSIADLVKQTNKKFGKYRLEIAQVLTQFKNQPDYFIPNLFYLLGDDDLDEAATGLTRADRNVMKSFAEKHREEVEKILDDHMDGLNKIREWSKQQKWPAGEDSLSRYTKFSYAVSEVKRAKEGLKELLK